MSTHVIPADPAQPHAPTSECGCDPALTHDRDSRRVYRHRDLTEGGEEGALYGPCDEVVSPP